MYSNEVIIMSNYIKTQLFDRENNILDEAYNIAASDDFKDCKLFEKYTKN